MDHNELKFLIALNQIICLGPVRLKKIRRYFPDFEAAWTAAESELARAGIESDIARRICQEKKKIDPAELMEQLQKTKIRAATLWDENYPKLLKEIYAPPILLYYLGEIDFNSEFLLAVVGSRKISEYGKIACRRIVGDLVRSGFCIASGLALGIDAEAHKATLKNCGRTIAVLGSGIDKIFPRANYFLAQEIISRNGAVISEFPLGMPALKQNFPQRNRIISGLSLGTLLIEAGEKSGALITAGYALEQNREVFAVPGSIIAETSIGSNRLIQQGAKAIVCAEDIIESFELPKKRISVEIKNAIPANRSEEKILNALGSDSLNIDKLCRLVRLDISKTCATLAIMELKGLIVNLGNNTYTRAGNTKIKTNEQNSTTITHFPGC